MDIAEVAKVSGIAAHTLRFYEKKGLISSIGRQGIRRQFHQNVIERLSLISLGIAAGFSLDEIHEMFTDSGPNIDRELLSSKANELDKKIKQLTAMRDGLRHAAQCQAPSHLECPNFLRILKIASNKRFKPQSKF
ncbi:helix-turn-helix domain-containing protein [Thalassotalea euphylliae]|uniref:helix-turn-helix domain-containing protein n=1 Tax=Thalassotalea euphylliae TaxID=1655234 RepID=UPI0036434EC4